MDARDRRELPVVGERAHRPADGRAREEDADRDDRPGRDDDGDELRLREADAADHVDLVLVDRVALRLRAVGEEQHLAQDEREPDRREEEAHEPGAPGAQRPPEGDVERERQGRGREHPEDRRRDHPEPERPVERIGGESAEGHEVAVGEVDEAKDPVDERHADGARSRSPIR